MGIYIMWRAYMRNTHVHEEKEYYSCVADSAFFFLSIVVSLFSSCMQPICRAWDVMGSDFRICNYLIKIRHGYRL